MGGEAGEEGEENEDGTKLNGGDSSPSSSDGVPDGMFDAFVDHVEYI